MKEYTFPNNPNWILFVNKKTQWKSQDDPAAPPPEDIIAILDDVTSIFAPHFKGVSEKRLAIIECCDVPLTYKGHGIIFLSADGKYWSQYVYQFAHEFCHFYIGKPVSKKLRWFEETLCEVASLFCLHALGKKWDTTPPYHNHTWTKYAPSFLRYANGRKGKCAEKPEGSTFSDYITKVLPDLERNEYMREVNTLCAFEMLPTFNKFPELWEDVRHISDLPDMPTVHALKHWKTKAKSKEAVQEIVNLFC